MSTPNKPTIPQWTCQVTTAGDVTVGTKFAVGCSGESVALLKTDSVVIYGKELDPVTKRASLNNLKILQMNSIDDRHFDAIATSYLAGKYQDDGFFILTDGHNEIALNNLKFNVASVMQQGQENKPYPAQPPYLLQTPLWFIVLMVAAVVLPLFYFWRVFRKQKQRRALIESLKNHKTARLPFDEFHREIRVLEKKHGVEPQDPKGYVLDLEKSFRMYLIRELIIPANDWSDRAIAAEIKAKHRYIFDEVAKQFKGLLKEFDRARKANVVSLNDTRQLYLLCLEISEGIFKLVTSKNKRGRV